jgi:hypothetical protein
MLLQQEVVHSNDTLFTTDIVVCYTKERQQYNLNCIPFIHCFVVKKVQYNKSCVCGGTVNAEAVTWFLVLLQL